MGNIYKSHHYQEPKRHYLKRIKPNHQVLIIWHLVAAYFYFSSIRVCDAAENDFVNIYTSTGNYRLVDLTHVFDNNTLYWVTEPSLNLNITYKGKLPDRDVWYQKDEIYAATHGGTHIDAPCHFAEGRWCVSDIPLERLVVPAVVVDISEKVQGNPDIHLTKELLLEWEEKHGRIPPQSLLMVYTGWSYYWSDRRQYTGTRSKELALLRFPSIKHEAAEFLVANRSVVGVGIDTMSVDIPNERPGTHVALMENNIYGLENVNNLGELPAKGATVYVMPMKLKDASGAPCRLLAQIPLVSKSSAESNKCFHIMIILLAMCAIYFHRI